MTEQQGTPDQLPAEKGQGGAGATYKVPDLTRGIFSVRRAQKHHGIMDFVFQLLHLFLSCSWRFLNLKTFVEKRWSCLVNVKMCWRRRKELAQSLWSRDRESLNPFVFHCIRVLFSSCCPCLEWMCAFLQYTLIIFHVARWVGFERPGFAGELFVLEKGEYPRWSTWTNGQSNYFLSSFRPLKVVSTWHDDFNF